MPRPAPNTNLAPLAPVCRIVPEVELLEVCNRLDQQPKDKHDPALNQTLPLGNTKERRSGATFCNNFLCGGRGASSERSCEKFDGENFEPLPVSLLGRREFHMCWGLKSGEVILLGGDSNGSTSEIISSDGTSSSPSFKLGTPTS